MMRAELFSTSVWLDTLCSGDSSPLFLRKDLNYPLRNVYELIEVVGNDLISNNRNWN